MRYRITRLPCFLLVFCCLLSVAVAEDTATAPLWPPVWREAVRLALENQGLVLDAPFVSMPYRWNSEGDATLWRTTAASGSIVIEYLARHEETPGQCMLSVDADAVAEADEEATRARFAQAAVACMTASDPTMDSPKASLLFQELLSCTDALTDGDIAYYDIQVRVAGVLSFQLCNDVRTFDTFIAEPDRYYGPRLAKYMGRKHNPQWGLP